MLGFDLVIATMIGTVGSTLATMIATAGWRTECLAYST